MIRTAGEADLPHLRRALYEAVSWNPEKEIPPFEFTIEHPELARYHAGWGREGDLAVVAESDEGDVVGAALCRTFTEEEHGHGYVDERTPELAVAVWGEHRGEGFGTALMGALEDLAKKSGYDRLSLSVDGDNPARRLYERLGYGELSIDAGGVRMIKTL